MTDDTTPSEASNAAREQFPDSVVFDVLGNARRRECLTQLLRVDSDEMPIRTLAEQVATELREDASPSDRFQQSVYVSLTQTHLPKLDEFDVVRYDTESKTVATAAHFELCAEMLAAPSRARQNGRTDGVVDGGWAADYGDVERPPSNASPDESPSLVASALEGGRPSFSRTVPLLASVVAVVVLLVATTGPTAVPDEIRVALALLHVLALGTLLSPVSV